MSLKGMQPVSPDVEGLQAVLSPPACKMDKAGSIQSCAGVPISALAMAGFRPPGRKKFVSAADTQGTPPTNPHGVDPAPTNSGPALALEVGSPKATCQFLTSRSPRVVLALMGRLRWRPPLKLYARLKDMSCPRSFSRVRFACCA